ncbi:glutamate 5-kinase [Priestia filamentosa]|uniref:Glutamate 5-kinase n=1 Tax=Priestia filamentosa TaxID=1402861 RepID=A0A1X7GET7_9BACI|nr:glutamate 5-kinase [Priestia filamentosa]AKO90900.1 glutamate 5-kinase [Priestia filamentosa]MDT3766009.1 glutamate 5-kinase [Priestia filamentosa]OXS65386.1 glutamate 5-kinase [Priestia filamentosa]RJS65746.1 glutamate 5-kinase [Priestia filamentosa]WCM16050.1 glutamate 5-kinase [Priestia filamentosa]
MKKQRVVVKIGSSSLTNTSGGIDNTKLREHAESIATLRAEGHEVVLISSGAVAAGFTELGYPSRPVTIKGKQASAALGQSVLMSAYIEAFSTCGIKPAQILLTRQDFAHRERYSNAYDTLSELLERSVLPIVNENDSVSIEELTFGDNDMLSALLSGLIHADRLIILTDINGLYDDNPNKNPDAKRIDYLEQITEEFLSVASAEGSKVGTGGMKSKLFAAEMALSLGVPTFIGSGQGPKKLLEVLEGNGDGTYVGAKVTGLNTRKQWIAFHSSLKGKVMIDEGAERALVKDGRSLLLAGVVEIEGVFKEGDVIEVEGKNGIIGKGEVCYSSEELNRLKGKRSDEVAHSIERSSYEVIHRNQWVGQHNLLLR